MTPIIRLTLIWTLLFSGFACVQGDSSSAKEEAQPTPTPTPQATSQSGVDEEGFPSNITNKKAYAVGYRMGRDLEMSKVDIVLEDVIAGIKKGYAGKAENEMKLMEYFAQFRQDAMEKAKAVQSAQGDENRKKAEAFLSENQNKEGVITTESGLQYKVIQEGSGEKPGPTSTVEVHYRGTLLDGTEFDSSHKRGQPAKFPLNQVIKGWTEGLQLMSVGSKYEFYIKPDLGYGERAMGNIPPGSALIFEVELLNIAK
jgi:FKBP-type peptidyl-prolyl cis-trans isomerase